MSHPKGPPTKRQISVLKDLAVRPMAAHQIGVRRDVLYRLEERGLVRRGSPGWAPNCTWFITTEGVEFVDKLEES